jgi:hypothetical protein
VNLTNANTRLAPGYTALESGYRRLDDGQLQKHCHEEMSYLAGFLLALYARETATSIALDSQV